MLDLRDPIVDQHIIIVEDIVDSGHTLDYLYHTLEGRNPGSLRTCTLLEKKRESLSVPIDYLGFTIPDVWVVGYGLAYADTHRTLPFVAELKPEVYQTKLQAFLRNMHWGNFFATVLPTFPGKSLKGLDKPEKICYYSIVLPGIPGEPGRIQTLRSATWPISN